MLICTMLPYFTARAFFRGGRWGFGLVNAQNKAFPGSQGTSRLPRDLTPGFANLVVASFSSTERDEGTILNRELSGTF
jgi:hypothetical protein